ncbi:RagB/SusD family nutrient uptake outer membrane protein [Polaribacter cellanae]|uniref:RagB/SusD family nutrient uptake outer membrane protein n=1 Tax=Polaribacter cellanae TaxID=2818493 RepID=A0A975CMX1_9FLAO|nr:RagB/SusD family nutrient uptake outer membrane protein [Polaribacter cellanae]QTE22568.1 RagB/SusD family nutrient uptake outer membrane protein [Polaribacter cellanae]
MKQLFNYLILFCLLLSYSCSDLLEEKVDNRTLITSLDEIEYGVANLAPRADYLFTDLMSDDYTFKNIAGGVNGTLRDQVRPIYEFTVTKQSLTKTSFISSGFSPYMAWRRYYYRINNAWLMLKKIEEYKPQSNSEKERLLNAKSECLAIKAYCNFMLVNLYAKQYDASTASSDFGPPFIDGYSAKSVEIFPQKSVEFYYNNIEKDLLEALKGINDDKRINKLHFNTVSIKALLSRLYLYKKDWKKCIKYSSETLEENNKLLAINKLIDKYIVQKNDLTEYSKQYFNPDQESYIQVSDNTFQLISYFYSGFYPYPIQEFAGNVGFAFYVIRTSPLFNDIIADKWLYLESRGSQRLQIMMPLFTVDEVVLNRAEAYIYNNQFAEAKAEISKILDLDVYRNLTKRKADLNAINTKEGLTKFLLETRRLRFFCEGMRWFDLKRYQLPITHTSDAGEFKIDGTNPSDYVIKPPVEEIDFRDYK